MRLRQSQSGNVAILSALVLPVLVGFSGLGADTGYWYYRQRTLQGAADIAAYNATVALRAGALESTIVTRAEEDAETNGWDSGRGAITVNTPPASGANQNANSVEVILTEAEPRFFSQIFTAEPVNIRVRAVATYYSSGLACILALNKTAPQAAKFWGNSSTTLNGCNIMSNSLASDAIAVGGSSEVTTPCAIAVGGVSISGELELTSCASPVTNAYPARDPYAGVPAPSTSGPCQTLPPNGPIQPGKYCNGALSINNTRTFNPGVYVISGGTFRLNANANVSGSGVTFYLTNGATIQFNGNAHLEFSAPTTGPYAGLVFFGDRTQPNATQRFNGDGTSSITGAIYFPSQAVEMNGNFSGVNGCMQVVADTITYTGSMSVSATCPGTGMADINIPGAVALVE